MLRSVVAACVLLSVTGCDGGEDADVVGLERKIEILEQQAKESAVDREAAQTELAEANANITAFEKRVAAAEVELRELKERTNLLERPTPTEVVPPAEVPAVKPPTPGRAVKDTRYRVELGDAFAKGSDGAKVTIVMFSDFQCPFCARAQATLKTLEGDYGKDIRFVAKHNPLPFHKEAEPAAAAAEAAGKQGKFWEMHDLLYENSRDLTTSKFRELAKKLRLNIRQFERDVDDSKLASKIDDDQAQAIKLGARGTPAFFVNGRFLSGAQPVSAFKVVIDDEITKADALIASGTSASGVYEKLIASGLERPE